MKIPSFLTFLMLAGSALAASAHEMNCEQRSGIDKARCERHAVMAGKCGPLKGEAHFACDREFLIANPLDCSKLQGNDARACQAELAAAKTCEPQAGRAFMKCVRDATAADPEGHPPKK
jgi:hypothetical protein